MEDTHQYNAALPYEHRKLKQEFAEMAERAAQELNSHRQLINQLQPMARGFEMIDQILRMGQQGNMGYTSDFASRLDTRAQELRDELDREAGLAEPQVDPDFPPVN